ncbi:glycosyltransferase family A protein [Treponema pectinovorum]|uniref:glycosyltransferase family A protein n=2 Tax=Treponema pectinovorum TaxID=164 RepID=UPI0011C726F1|nr:glycosyltransferase family A protein [Treponema pectinovorum]
MIFNRFTKRLSTEFFNFLPIRKNENIKTDLIISLTSFPSRLSKLHIVVRSLLKQTILPKRIVLYLGNDTKDSDIPKKLKRLTKYNFEIRTGYEDIKPHKKYFFAMQEFPENIIITVDDDLIYDKNLVNDLLECHRNNPNCVCARRVNRITKDRLGKIDKYSNWQWECKDIVEPSFELLATGCGGILYPSHILPKETFDAEAIKKYCLNTDDIWLKFMELKNRIKVVWTNSKIIHPLAIRKSQKTGLFHSNASSGNVNDINIKKMIEYTGINPADFF